MIEKRQLVVDVTALEGCEDAPRPFRSAAFEFGGALLGANFAPAPIDGLCP
jgi:hypothetical protein